MRTGTLRVGVQEHDAAIARQLGGNAQIAGKRALPTPPFWRQHDTFHSCLHEICLSPNHESDLAKKHENTQ